MFSYMHSSGFDSFLSDVNVLQSPHPGLSNDKSEADTFQQRVTVDTLSRLVSSRRSLCGLLVQMQTDGTRLTRNT